MQEVIDVLTVTISLLFHVLGALVLFWIVAGLLVMSAVVIRSVWQAIRQERQEKRAERKERGRKE